MVCKKSTPVTSKAQLSSYISKNSTTKLVAQTGSGSILSPNTGSKLYDPVIPSRNIKSTLNSMIGKK